jgi:multiple sugar transport system substrate-binding protein
MKKQWFAIVCLPLLILAACGNPNRPSVKNPVNLTVWHTLSSGAKDGFDLLLDEFNRTLGQKTGIVVTVDAVMDARPLNEMILKAASGDPGSPALPDMAVLYPSIAVNLVEKGKLAAFDDWFSKDELARFVPSFLEEGRLGVSGGPVYVLPFAKSTEAVFVNTTIFDRFAEGYAARYGGEKPDLSGFVTFEGIRDLAEKYYRWTDDNTPNIPHDGKAFFFIESVFNFFAVGFEQHGEPFMLNKKINISSPVFEKLMRYWYSGVAGGLFPVSTGYVNYLAQTGDIVGGTSSTAGAVYFSDTVTYLDNTKEPAVFVSLPYPVFEGGTKIALQRGGGFVLCKSSELREYAASVFLKWLTAPEQNLRFTARSGYMPVESGALETALPEDIEFENALVEQTFRVAMGMRNSYGFYTPPVFDGLSALQSRFAAESKKIAEQAGQSGAPSSEEVLQAFTGQFR